MKHPVLAALAATVLIGMSSAQAEVQYRVLAFGDSNTWGWKATQKGFPAERHDDDSRWAGVLDKALPGTKVVVDGLVGRRTDLNGESDIALVEARDFNGALELPEAIARNMPLDLVLVMLGTNDLQSSVNRKPEQIATAAFELARLVGSSEKPVYSAYGAPRVLIIAPPPMSDTTATPLSGLFQAGVEPSRLLGDAFAAKSRETGIPFFDAGSVTATDGVDGVHLSAENHKTLGLALAPIVERLLAQ